MQRLGLLQQVHSTNINSYRIFTCMMIFKFRQYAHQSTCCWCHKQQHEHSCVTKTCPTNCVKSHVQLTFITAVMDFQQYSTTERWEESEPAVLVWQIHVRKHIQKEPTGLNVVCYWMAAFNQYTVTRMSWERDHGSSGCHEQSLPSTSLDLSCRELKWCRRVSVPAPRPPVAWSHNWQSLLATTGNNCNCCHTLRHTMSEEYLMFIT